MKKLFLTVFFFNSLAFSQAGSSAVPFLLISTSVEANGMGGIMTVANSSSPSCMMFNPAQLGLSSRTDMLSTEMYSHRVNWLPAFNLSDLWINNYSFMYGMKFPLEENNNISIGLGYSRIFLNLGEFVVITDTNLEPVATFNGYETSDNFSMGVGIDLGFTLAFGSTLKKITSRLSPIGTAEERGSGTANIWASDIGLLAKFPVVDFFYKDNVVKENTLSPFLDITAAYTLNNLGGSVVYIDASQADPLPRTARLGWSSEAGIKYNTDKIDLSLINVTIAREAENLLIEKYLDGTWTYKGAPLGNINIYNNLIASRANGYITIRRGFSFNLFETITIRQGSYEGDGNLSYSTTGYTISTRGVMKFFNSTKSSDPDFNPMQFLISHLEIRFSHSEYQGHDIVGGTYFDNLIFSFHH